MTRPQGDPALEPGLTLILERHLGKPHHVLQALREIQEAFQCVSPQAVGRVADALGVPLARVRGVVGFYAFLGEQTRGRYRVLFSDNITDRMLGNMELLATLCEKLWVEQGRLSEDGLVSVDTTSCTGLCDQGPAILVNGRAIPRVTPERLERIAELILAQTPMDAWPAELFAIEDNVRRRDILLNDDFQPGDALRVAVARVCVPGSEVEAAANERSWREGIPGAALCAPLSTLEEIKRSNLRGRGGAGFTTGMKWEACRNAPGKERYVVCNADEGEPGTFKDRVLLRAHADLVFEGMTVCAYAIGAHQGFLYLRGEYRFLLEPLNEILARRRAANLLGKDILGQAGFDFDIEIHLGAGAYVCGEESALIESLEGKRGVPRNRPPYPVTHGYLQKPTTVNNVETFCAAALIAKHGGDWYRAIGTAKSAGTKLLSVAGDCARPGIYEYPFGTPVRQVLEDCGAGAGKHSTLAVQISGPSGVCIDASEFERRIAFEDLPTAGAFTVFDTSRDMFEVARNYAHFFAHESCGFCTPCRVGTAMLKTTMDKIAEGHGTVSDLAEIEKLDKVLHLSAHCGLGHTACNPTLDTLKRFRPMYERRLKSLDFEPAFDLDGALATARRMTGRDDAGAHLEMEP
ncbi:MAG: NAD(P)H-dependent oxidoreductase subunit E [Thiobacillaceae bacterium]|nr:NAD(P)H-dependent oxidoreductase subunit E [Thiobacillaceae bacterium]